MDVVIDTNVFISGSLWNGNESRIIDLCINGSLRNHSTMEILLEIEKVLAYPKFSLTSNEQDRLLRIYMAFSNIISVGFEENGTCRDEDDNMIIACAKESPAEMIITGDEDLLCMKEIDGIQVLRSVDVLNIIPTVIKDVRNEEEGPSDSEEDILGEKEQTPEEDPSMNFEDKDLLKD